MPLVLALLAALVQDPETERLRKEVQRLQAELKAAELRRSLLPAPPVPATPAVASPGVKVTAVANEIDLVVLSAGKEDGVQEGDAYALYRAGEFVGKVVVDRGDRKWSAGKVQVKRLEPRVADDAVRERAPAPLTPKGADSLRDIRKELDEIRRQIRALSDQLVPSWTGAGVAVEEASEDLKAHLGLDRGLLVRRVREGSAAAKAGLRPLDVLPKIGEARLLEALEKGEPLDILRQGKAETLRR